MKKMLFLLGLLFLSTALHAQTWHSAGVVGDVLELPDGCLSTWYDPEVFVYPDGSRGFLAQGGMGSPCFGPEEHPLDSIFRAKFDPIKMKWEIPAADSCPTIVGAYANSNCPDQDFDGFQPLASPAVAKVGGRYFMAFCGGNVDFRKGHLFWATSTNGVNWTVLKWDPKPPGYAWRPLIYPRVGDFCEQYGIAQLTLSYDESPAYGSEGAFYLHFNYKHRGGELDTYTFRFKYSSANGFGLGGGMQVCINNGPRGTPGTWLNHSGLMVFDYNAQAPEPGDPVLTRYGGNLRNFDHGSGSIVWDPSHSSWLRNYVLFDEVVRWQSCTSLASGVWSEPKIVDMPSFHAQVKAHYMTNEIRVLYGGLWWGRIGTRTNMWMVVPATGRKCDPNNPYLALGMFTVAMNFW